MRRSFKPPAVKLKNRQADADNLLWQRNQRSGVGFPFAAETISEDPSKNAGIGTNLAATTARDKHLFLLPKVLWHNFWREGTKPSRTRQAPKAGRDSFCTAHLEDDRRP